MGHRSRRREVLASHAGSMAPHSFAAVAVIAKAQASCLGDAELGSLDVCSRVPSLWPQEAHAVVVSLDRKHSLRLFLGVVPDCGLGAAAAFRAISCTAPGEVSRAAPRSNTT